MPYLQDIILAQTLLGRGLVSLDTAATNMGIENACMQEENVPLQHGAWRTNMFDKVGPDPLNPPSPHFSTYQFVVHKYFSLDE